MAKLTQRQKKNIVSAYAAGGVSYADLAAKYKVSKVTISRILKEEKNEFETKCNAIKKEAEDEAVQEMVQAITDRRKFAEELLDDILQSAKKKVSAAPLRDLMGAAKVLRENFLGGEDPNGSAGEDKTFTVVICDNGHQD